MCFSLLIWCVVGLIVGALARAIVPGREPLGCAGTILLGIVGSAVGGMLGSVIFREAYRPAGFLGSLVGAVITLLVWRRLAERGVPPY